MSNVVFIVTGQDYGAMWSLVAANIAEDDVALEPGLGRSIRSLATIAVLMSGGEDILHVRIPHPTVSNSGDCESSHVAELADFSPSDTLDTSRQK